jgi:hypothetical protein
MPLKATCIEGGAEQKEVIGDMPLNRILGTWPRLFLSLLLFCLSGEQASFAICSHHDVLIFTGLKQQSQVTRD